MNNRFRNILFVVLVIGQVAISPLLPFLALQYRSALPDYFLCRHQIGIHAQHHQPPHSSACAPIICRGGVMGVFSFSRTLAAYFLNVVVPFFGSEEERFYFFTDLCLPVPVQSAGFSFLCADLPLTDHGQPPDFSAVVHRRSRHDHSGIQKSEIPAGCILAKGS